MLSRTGNIVVSNGIGIGLMVIGWYISIVNVGLSHLKAYTLFNSWTLAGLFLIVLGAYLPGIWTKVSNG